MYFINLNWIRLGNSIHQSAPLPLPFAIRSSAIESILWCAIQTPSNLLLRSMSRPTSEYYEMYRESREKKFNGIEVIHWISNSSLAGVFLKPRQWLREYFIRDTVEYAQSNRSHRQPLNVTVRFCFRVWQFDDIIFVYNFLSVRFERQKLSNTTQTTAGDELFTLFQHWMWWASHRYYECRWATK